MHAWLCENPTGVDAVTWKELPTPQPGAGEVLIATGDTSLQSTSSGIFDRLLAHCGIDFRDYKPTTVLRRIERRMTQNGIDDLRKANGLSGMMRVTYVAPGDPLGLRHARLVEMGVGGDDLYRSNIQIGELNSLNACLALIRYKQLRGFYVDATQAPWAPHFRMETYITRDLLEAVTLSPAMGIYLSMLGNQGEDPVTGRMPDENYAREVMQL